jgi:signal transduction histidine kinase/CheY-like chemotaxis protein
LGDEIFYVTFIWFDVKGILMMKKINYALIVFSLAVLTLFVSILKTITEIKSKIEIDDFVFLIILEASTVFLVLVIMALAIYLHVKEAEEKSSLVLNIEETEKKLSRLEQKVRESDLKAVESSRSKTMFLAIAGHELRTPLIGMIGFADLLRKSNLAEKETSYADNIYYSGKALLKTLNNTMEYAKIELGQIELENAEFDLAELFSQIISTLLIKAQEKKISLNYFIDKDVPRKVYGDSSRLSQIIYNLVGNGIKFTAVGSVTLRVKVLSIDPANCLHLHFLVEDTGVGLSIEQQQKIFLPFNIIQSKKQSAEEGPGLGLAISMQLAKAMGGEIHVSSELGNGSCFSFITIFSQYSQEKVGEAELTRGPVLAEHNTIVPIFGKENMPTIMVVDDNETNLLMAQAILEKLGAKTIVATNGKEAIYENSKSKVDLVLMDCQMPVMDGFVTTRELRKQKVTIPILAMTAYTAREDQENCFNAGMNGFIAKPVSIKLLANELKKSLTSYVSKQ